MKDEDLLSESSHSEAARVFQTWQSEDDEMMTNLGVVSDEEDDVFMQLEEDEGLLPSSLDDFYDTITQTLSGDSTSMLLLSSSQGSSLVPPRALISNCSDLSCTSDFIMSVTFGENDRARFQTTLCKLSESMRRSQETRRSLYARTPGLKDYKRLGSVERVLQSVEFSSHHVKVMASAGAA